MNRPVAIASFLVATAALPLIGQQPAPTFKTPRPSQRQVLTQTVGVTDVTVTYSRPGVKGRQIWGGLVPYDKVWRTGANEATTVAFSDDVTINGQALPKGTYSLHTIPGKDEWTIIFNKTANQWGSYSYDAAQDALRLKVKPQPSPFTEWMMFDVPQLSTDDATFAIRWENIAVPFTVGANTTVKVSAAARAAIAVAKPDDWQTAYRAAQFAMNAGLPDDASKWVDQSIKVIENPSNLFLKAQLQARSGDRAGAVKTAQRAVSKGTDKDKEFVAEIQKNIDTWQKSDK